MEPAPHSRVDLVDRPTTGWMWELAVHYERIRRAYPDQQLCVVFDIDGTILDLRHLVVHALLGYDREHGSEYFHGLRAEADETHEILFLHADTIFESQRVVTPRTVRGSTYDLAELVSEEELRRRVQFVWHGVNDEANLRQFLASGVHWAECDIRRDPLGRLVLRHDSFEETPWHRGEQPFRLEACLRALRERERSAALDPKEGGDVVERVLGVAAALDFDEDALWFNGSIEVLGEPGIRRLAEAYPAATISVPVDFLGPLLIAAPALAKEVLAMLRSWGVNRWSLDWRTPGIRELMDRLEGGGWPVNVYGIPNLEAFLEASLLLPQSVTADFNFPDWHYFGRGSGQHRAYHRYDLARNAPSTRSAE